MTAPHEVIIGSFPPIPLPASGATVAEVRRSWESGATVTVVSPRLSAADLAVPVAGPLAGRRLENVRRHTGATRLVLVAEPGVPVPVGPAWLQRLTVAALARAMRRFTEVRIVRVGDLGLSDRTWRTLTAGAAEVTDWPAAGPLPRPPAGVTPLGPAETLRREWPAVAAGRLARLLLGRWAGPVRSRLGAVKRSLKRA